MARTGDRPNWPTPQSDQSRVMLLGTSHLDSPRIEDVCSVERQREFERLVDRLADWRPNAIAVERSRRNQDHVEARYEEYRSGERAYDDRRGFESPRMFYDGDAPNESEVVQVGFRLADRLDHDRVYAADSMMDMAAHLDRDVDGEWLQEQTESAIGDLNDALVPTPPDHLDQWDSSSVTEFLAWYNREARLRVNDRRQFAAAFGGPAEHYVGSRLLTGWYERNLRIGENLRTVADDTGDDRVLFVVGQAHVHVLRHLLDNVPLVCPVSPLPILED